MARTVKLADLSDNMRLDRLGHEPTVEDARRQRKYLDAYTALFASAGETGTATTPKSGVVHEHATAEGGDAQ
jgi:hypothetical protein